MVVDCPDSHNWSLQKAIVKIPQKMGIKKNTAGKSHPRNAGNWRYREQAQPHLLSSSQRFFRSLVIFAGKSFDYIVEHKLLDRLMSDTVIFHTNRERVFEEKRCPDSLTVCHFSHNSFVYIMTQLSEGIF